MHTINHIINEMKNIPVNRLEEVYQLLRALNPNRKNINKTEARAKILSFAGAFSDMTRKDYEEFLNVTIKTRNQLFNRKITE